jgi:hypothetical protein
VSEPRASGNVSGPFAGGRYRRRIRVVATEPGVVQGGLEDDFHHFEVTLRHDGSRVIGAEGRGVRTPWTTCGDAAGPLRALSGMPLSLRPFAAAEHTSPRLNCTHMFDLAALAIAQAARGTPHRQYDVEVPFAAQWGGRAVVRLWRDHELALEWVLDGPRVIEPEPYTNAPWRGGFKVWAQAHLDVETAEAAIVLRRACEIGTGRGIDLDALDRAEQLPAHMIGVCYTLQPTVVPIALRNKGTIRDFDDAPDRLLAHGPESRTGQ